jgi:hypothetical protein
MKETVNYFVAGMTMNIEINTKEKMASSGLQVYFPLPDNE